MEFKQTGIGKYGLFGKRAWTFMVLFTLLFILFGDSYRKNDPIFDDNEIVSSTFWMKKISQSDSNLSVFSLTNIEVGEIFTRNKQRLLYDTNGDLILNKDINQAYQKGFVFETPNIDFDLVTYQEAQKNQSQQIRKLTLDDLIPRPKNPDPNKLNILVYPDYNITVPIIETTVEDFYYKNADGSIDYTRLIDPSKMTAWESTQIPIQIKLRSGVVHISPDVYPTSVEPGEIGNTYIVGHSSNYNWVQSNYNEIFKPLEKRSQVGQEFIIYDKFGRELKFRVFETVLIEETNTNEAYKLFDDKRVVTLQTSVLTWNNGRWIPTHRWLTRGELELGV